MESLIVFVVEISSIIWYATTLPVDGTLAMALEVIPCLLVSTVSFIVSLFLKTRKRKLYKTIIFLAIWVPIRYKWLLYIYEGSIPPFDYEALYFCCNITIPETLVLLYYFFKL